MAFSPGARLGPYEIVGVLGAGGMGEVYQARDTRLDRPVAVKVLPADVCTNLDRLARFEQEARAAAALNDPHILAVYDVGREEGSPFIVSELLEGHTLRDRMSHGPLPPRKTIDYATQIARPGRRAHPRNRASRSEAGEHLHHERRSCEDPRLRPGEADRGGSAVVRIACLGADWTSHGRARHHAGAGAGHRRLHGARAGPRTGHRSPRRHLCVRRDPLRDAVGPPGIHRIPDGWVLGGLGAGSAPPTRFALSPDGRRLAFVARTDKTQRLWVRPLDAPSARSLDGTDGATMPFWSADSRFVGFFADGKVKKIDPAGRPAIAISEAPFVPGPPTGATWNGNGKELLYVTATDMMMSVDVDASGTEFVVGQERRLFEAPFERNGYTWYDVAADGQKLLINLRGDRRAEPPPLTVVVNWLAGVPK